MLPENQPQKIEQQSQVCKKLQKSKFQQSSEIQKQQKIPQQQSQIYNKSHLSLSQTSALNQKEQKQSSNDGLNSQRSFPSSISNYIEKDKPLENKQNIKKKTKKRERKTSTHYLKEKTELQTKKETIKNQTFQDEENDSSQSEESQIQLQANALNKGGKASLTLVRLFFMICKKEYFQEIIRIFLYALISITVFSYVLDQNREKKQFYQAFYSSQQITISKDINGVFPPLFGSKNDIMNHTWVLQSYNSHLLVNSQETNQQTKSQLLFEFKAQNVLYIRPNIETCAEQLKFRWKTFDYNMRIYEVLQSEFQKIQDDQSKNCFKNKKQMASKMRQISLWTIDWQSKQLYLLTEPFKDEIIDDSGNNNKPQKWNELIVLKKQSLNI